MVCNFPDWAAEKLFAPIEKKVEEKIADLEEKLWYKIEHKSNTNISNEYDQGWKAYGIKNGTHKLYINIFYICIVLKFGLLFF